MAQKDESHFFIAGCDEVGRGPLAGPVVAACVSIEMSNKEIGEVELILKNWKECGVNDSKKLSAKKRLNILKTLSITSLKKNQIINLFYSKNILVKILIKEIQPSAIDECNILQASLRAMKRAVIESRSVDLRSLVLIDGNRKFIHKNPLISLETIVKGDSKSLLIGLASIVAKEYRDQLMKKMSKRYTHYGWERNAGYPTKEHLFGIENFGITKYHRVTFKGVKEVYAKRGIARI